VTTAADQAPAPFTDNGAAPLPGLTVPAPPRSHQRSPSSTRPPTKRPHKRRADSAPRSSAPKPKSLAERLTGGVDGLGQLVELVEPFDGACLRQNADKLGPAFAELSDKSPLIARGLTFLLGLGDNAAPAAVIVAVALPMLSHHNLLPARIGALTDVLAGMLGTVPDVDPDAAPPLAGLLAAAAEQAAAAEEARIHTAAAEQLDGLGIPPLATPGV
jgi:hypothetical protein